MSESMSSEEEELEVGEEEANAVPPAIDVSYLPDWASHLRELWRGLPDNLEAVKQYNQNVAQREPHCAVCSLFKPINVSKLFTPVNNVSSQMAYSSNLSK